jgi:hypothetical protein
LRRLPRNVKRQLRDRLQERVAPAASETGNAFADYRFEAARYIEEKLGWTPWRGSDERPGQQEIIDAYTLALLQQHERADYEAGIKTEDELTVWKPGVLIQNWIRVEAGHTVGKTKLSSGLVNHFFDCFTPAIIYTFAPTWKQIHDLLWKEIKTDRRGKGLPGRILDLELKVNDDHFANGVAASDAGGNGTERVQGQHGKYLMFVVDEAEGVAAYVQNAINSMASGGICIVLMLANPRTRLSWFYRIRELSKVRNFRISCIGHPNVLAGREIVPGAVRRDYVETMLEEHCEIVSAHNEDDLTFEVPWQTGLIFRPDAEFMFRVLGIAPANQADDTFLPVGRYEAALKRQPIEDDPKRARIGIDAAGYGNDLGTIYVRHNGKVWRAGQCSKPGGDQDATDYWQKTKKASLALKAAGVTSLHIRIDAGGGFGNGVYDRLKHDEELRKSFKEFKLYLVHFGGSPKNGKAYADLATEMYAECAESVRGLAIEKPPVALEADLCERKFEWVNLRGVEVKKLVAKKVFRKDKGRSPDDGDGFVLCVSPDFLFTGDVVEYGPSLWN